MGNLCPRGIFKLTQTAVLVAAVCASASAHAQMNLNFGVINVNPDSDLSEVDAITSGVGVGSSSTLGITLDYYLSPNIAVEVITALPFKHDIRVESGTLDGAAVGETKHLPPTVLAQYHLGSQSNALRPFVGVGFNYTDFFEESADGDLQGLLGQGTTLELDSSFGLAGQLGVNYAITPQWGVHAVATYIDIDTDATITSGDGLTVIESKVAIDPWVVMLGASFTF